MVHAVFFQRFNPLLIEQRVAGTDHFFGARLVDRLRGHAAQHTLCQRLNNVTTLNDGLDQSRQLRSYNRPR